MKPKTKKDKSSKFKDFQKGKNSKGKSDYEDMSKKPSCSYENDYLWYGMNEQLIQQFDSWSFDDVIGIPPHLEAHPVDASTYQDYLNVGAILQIELFPTIGYQGGPQAPYAYRSAVGDASQRIYTILSASNGKTTKYLPEDPALVILMLGNITSMSACYWRLVGIRNLFSPRNRLVPNKLIEAMGFNSSDFLKKISNSMERYNNIVARLNGISMFADIPYFSKCNEIFRHIFFDKNSAMGQYYITKPAGWFRYTDGAIDPNTGYFVGNKLEYTEWSGLLEIDDFLDIMERQVNDMLQSSLFNYVYSDVIREIRRNGGQVYQFNAINENYLLLPEFSEVFMTQVHNMTWGLVSSLNGYTISDNVDTLDLKDNLDYSLNPENISKFFAGDQIIDFPYTDNPDYKLVAEALAYKTLCDKLITTGSAAGTVMRVAMPDHAVYKMHIINVWGSSGLTDKLEIKYIASEADILNYVLWGIENFDIRPNIKVVDTRQTPSLAYFTGELNYFTSITEDKVERIFRQAFIKLFSSATFDSNTSITSVSSSEKK